ncbi:hypothetical protein F5Y17DRAFT_70627 [Xylariaceae sp. FL0594]|nr:hypothetical protein F5Y17DRAFT_70627 [Xylariaceae sp. FL0594]
MADPTEYTGIPLDDTGIEYQDDIFQGIDFSANFDDDFEQIFARDIAPVIPNEPQGQVQEISVPEPHLELPAQPQPIINPAAETFDHNIQFIQPQQTYVQPIPQHGLPLDYNFDTLWVDNPSLAFSPNLAHTLIDPPLAPAFEPTTMHNLLPNVQHIYYPQAAPVAYQPVYQPRIQSVPAPSSGEGEPSPNYNSNSSSSSSSRLPSVSPRRKVVEEDKFPPSPESIDTDTPRPKRPARNHHGEPLRNDKIPRRTHRKKLGTQNIEPENYYGPPPPKPKSWGPKNAKGEYLFNYTEKGELAPGKFFTTKEMRKYLLGPAPGQTWQGPTRHPGVKAIKGKYRQGLTLWIGWPAAMANSRYPRGGESTKCRFADCLHAQHTIYVGQPWVIFDERQNTDGEAYDPFYNAGYCHLYCLESKFDIVELWGLVDIRADTRTFKREQYEYFNLCTKLPGIDKVFQQWWATAMAEAEAARGVDGKGRRNRTRENSLDACLVEFKLSMEGRGQTRTRQRRNGIDITKHRGDPELKRKLQTYRKYQLLDENGTPYPDADEQVEFLENEKKKQKKMAKAAAAGRRDGACVPQFDPRYQTLPGQQLPGSYEHVTSVPHTAQFSHPYAAPSSSPPLEQQQQQQQQQPYQYAPQFTPPAGAYMQHPLTPYPPQGYSPQGYAAETHHVQQPVPLPIQEQEPVIVTDSAAASRKRNLDDVVAEDADILVLHAGPVRLANPGNVDHTVQDASGTQQSQPSPKRQRLDDDAKPCSPSLLFPQLSETTIPFEAFDNGADTVLDSALLDDVDLDAAMEEFLNNELLED